MKDFADRGRGFGRAESAGQPLSKHLLDDELLDQTSRFEGLGTGATVAIALAGLLRIAVRR
ncbi:hypothetical protein ACFY0A_41105 [Streptomyces sp. NPDC001698]|uniref:hypothetical protein n=1 Tax=unclassified Streptomyces TaxID=2593676 RepID=UPI00367AAE2B